MTQLKKIDDHENEPEKVLYVKLPQSIHREFKKHCVLEDIDMQELTLQLIKERLKKFQSGNPAFSLDNWQDNADFHARPAFDAKLESWKKHYESMSYKDYMEVGRKLESLCALHDTMYNKRFSDMNTTQNKNTQHTN